MSEPTTYELERMAVGEIPTPDEYAEEVAALRASDAEILRRYAPKDYVPAIEAAATPTQAANDNAVRWWVGAGGIAAVAIAVVAIGLSTDRPAERTLVPGTTGEVRVKGPEVRLQLWQKTEAGERLLEDGTIVGAGDVVQPKFGVVEPGWGVLFSLDGAGNVTRLFPMEGEEPRLTPGGMRASSFAYELDEAPDFERFYFVACSNPVEPKEAIERVRSDRSLDEECTVETVELKKR